MHRGAKKKIGFFIVGYLFFVGLLDYPFVARIYNSYIQGKCITAYEKAAAVHENKEKAIRAARKYNQSLGTGTAGITDAFKKESPSEESYLKLLSVNDDHTMGSLSIPEIHLELPIYHGTSEEVLQKGVGHLEGSSLPVGGKGTHACLSAHRGLPNKRMFTNLDLLEKGDVFYVRVLHKVFAYEIFDIRTVLPHEIEYLSIKKVKDLVTLITCAPYGINTHRIYVTGRRIPYRETEKKEVITSQSWWRLNWYLPVTAFLLLMLVYMVWILKRREKELS